MPAQPHKLNIMHYIVIVMAVLLQIQATFFAQEGYLGLRIGIADLFLPFAGLYVLFSMFISKTSIWPRWSVRHMLVWLFALLLIMSSALLNGYIVNGTVASWAFINKYIGFLILLSYLALGGWIATNAKDMRHITTLFMGVFTKFFLFTIALSLLAFFLQPLVPFSLWISDYPWDGLMANRNAYMVTFIIAFIFIIWSYADNKTMIPAWVQSIFWCCLPIFFVFNASRTGWIIAIALAVILLLKNPIKRLKSIIPFLILGVVITYASFYATTSATSEVLQGKQMRYLFALQNERDELYMGDEKRYIAVEDGLELYHLYDPMIGAGLGSYRPFQIEKRGKFIEIIDFSGLWLLVETGALGVAVFAAFFMTCLWSLYQTGFVKNNNPYHRSMLTFLIMFAAMSMLHELIYTRALWFALGLALAYNHKDQQPNTNAS
ncbi:MAG: hypothetical protein COB14_05090 [Alphaproteobacteria bacterium]|nr:MAG: hypothetical protein COB14_05090 [Alphaproteobacteria bacterium]